jgi:DNA primase
MVGDVPDDLEWELSKRSVILSVGKQESEVEAAAEGPSIDEWTLSRYGDISDRLLERRHLLRSSVDAFGVRWDPVAKTWVIPIRSPEGDLMGFQFRQKGTVINHPTGMEKSTTLFGLHLFKERSIITVVESPLDAVRLMNVSVAAVSTFGAGISDEQITLLARNFRTVVVAMDNDGPGQRATEYMQSVLRRRGCIVMPFDYSGLSVKDPGDIECDASLRDAWTRSTLLLQTK